MARQETLLKTLFDLEQDIKTLRENTIDADITAAQTLIASIKTRVDATKTTMDAATTKALWDALA